jgi:hypothetical protein
MRGSDFLQRLDFRDDKLGDDQAPSELLIAHPKTSPLGRIASFIAAHLTSKYVVS